MLRATAALLGAALHFASLEEHRIEVTAGGDPFEKIDALLTGRAPGRIDGDGDGVPISITATAKRGALWCQLRHCVEGFIRRDAPLAAVAAKRRPG